MAVTRPETESMKISEVRSSLNALVNRIYRNEARVVIEKSGIPVAAVVSIEDLELLRRFDVRARDIQDVLDSLSRRFEDISAEEIERESLRAADEAKAAMRAERDFAADSRR